MKNAKLILAVFVLICLIAACKKDYTCECTTTITERDIRTDDHGNVRFDWDTTYVSKTNTTVYKKMKKSTMKRVCGNYSSDYKISTPSSSPLQTITNIQETKCQVK